MRARAESLRQGHCPRGGIGGDWSANPEAFSSPATAMNCRSVVILSLLSALVPGTGAPLVRAADAAVTAAAPTAVATYECLGLYWKNPERGGWIRSRVILVRSGMISG